LDCERDHSNCTSAHHDPNCRKRENKPKQTLKLSLTSTCCVCMQNQIFLMLVCHYDCLSLCAFKRGKKKIVNLNSQKLYIQPDVIICNCYIALPHSPNTGSIFPPLWFIFIRPTRQTAIVIQNTDYQHSMTKTKKRIQLKVSTPSNVIILACWIINLFSTIVKRLLEQYLQYLPLKATEARKA